MSFNILTALRHQDEHPWDERRAAVAKTVTSHSVDVLGVQEASISRDWDDNDDDIPQWESLRRALAKKGYGHALTGSDGKYEDCGKKDCSDDEAEQFGLHIFYKKATVEPIGTGGTVNVDNDWCEWDDRAMVWQVFRTRTTPSTTFLMVNTHLDFEGINERGDFERCRNGQVKNILKALRTSINPQGLPVLFMGDLNSYAYQKPVKTLLKNGFRDTAKVDAPGKNTTFNSFHGFKNPLPRVPGKRIDYIMVDKGIGVKSWELVVKIDPRTGKFKGKVPSDHHPLLAVLAFPSPKAPELKPAAPVPATPTPTVPAIKPAAPVPEPQPTPDSWLCGANFPDPLRQFCS
ncbi:endonuclease/exonuclease/phosphatase family protein [Paeniglutamicibacter kerguelensis]|uniref:Endonuclease/exonuclease/phosphatase family metal-dependent hydrolase n=2 Tax=Paeniglutamicibacter kerguelensis TaxID=254788 RepID=A0ABS4XE30_9MICC|nr:endonuclease/exonuclease/phosphatase family protein [Paeniglutamicibacter kerguelensis]MBP2386728.1 endonuclease/exonuclease/phosphatase family metal-dependent hydrolase [Paeniglutamicibacter kerguelensis]